MKPRKNSDSPKSFRGNPVRVLSPEMVSAQQTDSKSYLGFHFSKPLLVLEPFLQKYSDI